MILPCYGGISRQKAHNFAPSFLNSIYNQQFTHSGNKNNCQFWAVLGQKQGCFKKGNFSNLQLLPSAINFVF